MSFAQQAAFARFSARPWQRSNPQPAPPAPMSYRKPPPAAAARPHDPALSLTQRRALNPALVATRGVVDVLACNMATLQRQVRVTRGKDTDAARATLRQQLRTMSLPQQATALRTRLRAAALSRSRVSALSQYTVFMATKGLEPILPITFDEAGPFLSWKVLDKTNLSHNLKSVLSNLRCAATAIGQWAVSKSDEDLLDTLIGELQATVPSSARVTHPVDPSALLAAAAALRSVGTLEAEQTRAIILVAPAVLARGTETSGRELGMKWGDFSWDTRGLGFNAYFSKKGKKSADPRPRASPHPPDHWAELCPVKCLQEFKTLWSAAGGNTAPDTPIWCAVVAGRPSLLPLTCDQIMASCKRALLAHGAEPESLHAHWPRHTGSNLLTAHYAVVSRDADMMGDWVPKEAGSNVAAPKSTRKSVYEHPPLRTLMDMAFSAMGGPRPLLCCPALGKTTVH